MLPGLTSDDQVDRTAIDAKDSGDSVLANSLSVKVPHLTNNIGCDFGKPKTTFLQRVSHIVGLRASEQMRRLDAVANITGMAHHFVIFWEFAGFEKVYETCDVNRFARFTYLHLSILCRTEVAGPNKTFANPGTAFSDKSANFFGVEADSFKFHRSLQYTTVRSF